MTAPVATSRATDGSTHRLFFALWPDKTTRGRIAAVAAQLRAHGPSGRWIPAARYHLTLQFLGTYPGYPAALAEAACAAAARVRSPETAITLDRIGSFPRRPRLWWLGSRHPEPLLPLWESLTGELLAEGVEVDTTPLVPHVTLVRGAGRAPPPDAAVRPVVWRVAHFALIHGESGDGTTYDVLRQWPLESVAGSHAGRG